MASKAAQAKADRAYWQQFEFEDYKLVGWTGRDSALFGNSKHSLQVNRRHIKMFLFWLDKKREEFVAAKF